MNKDNITNNEQTDEENEEQAVTCQVSDNGIFASENAKHNIHCLNVIGQIEGHYILPPQNKTTKYEHIMPALVAIEQDMSIDGLLIILNTVGGDVEAGLAISELIAGMSKPTVSIVVGGGHSIGVPLAVSARKSFIVPSATMTIHPVRMNGLLLGIPQTLSYFERMQERIINFVSKNSRIKPERFRELMMKKDEGLIDSLGGLSDAVQCLYSLIEQQKTDKESAKHGTGKTVSKKSTSSATAKTDTKTAGKGKATARVSTFREYHPSAQRAEMRAKRGAENVSDRCR